MECNQSKLIKTCRNERFNSFLQLHMSPSSVLRSLFRSFFWTNQGPKTSQDSKDHNSRASTVVYNLFTVLILADGLKGVHGPYQSLKSLDHVARSVSFYIRNIILLSYGSIISYLIIIYKNSRSFIFRISITQ